ncbi:hypothetical protein HDU76_011911, partial [Blyttiomyces sp. JEL0837]
MNTALEIDGTFMILDKWDIVDLFAEYDEYLSFPSNCQLPEMHQIVLSYYHHQKSLVKYRMGIYTLPTTNVTFTNTNIQI